MLRELDSCMDDIHNTRYSFSLHSSMTALHCVVDGKSRVKYLLYKGFPT